MKDHFDSLNNLWHYTSWKSCQEILRPNDGAAPKLWASNLSYVNDMSERKEAFSLILSMVNGEMREMVRETIRIVEFNSEAYAVSFSGNPDSLSQWRAYGTGGVQVAIGFDRTRLERMAANANYKLVDCEYDDKEQRKLLNETVEKLEEVYAKFVAECRRAPNHPLSGQMWKGQARKAFNQQAELHLHFVAAVPSVRIKNDAFKDEEEVRLVGPFLSPDRNLNALAATNGIKLPTKFHERHRLVVPHLEFTIDKPGFEYPVNAIRIGPGPHKELQLNSIGSWTTGLARHSDGTKLEIAVLPSKATYRDW